MGKTRKNKTKMSKEYTKLDALKYTKEELDRFIKTASNA